MHLRVPSTTKRRAAETLGRSAEDDVALSWQAKGYSVLAQRLRTGAGELDLVLADRDTLVFVEVKGPQNLGGGGLCGVASATGEAAGSRQPGARHA